MWEKQAKGQTAPQVGHPHGKASTASRVDCSPSHQPRFCRGLCEINSWKRAGQAPKLLPKLLFLHRRCRQEIQPLAFQFSVEGPFLFPPSISFHHLLHHLLLPGPSQTPLNTEAEMREAQSGFCKTSASFFPWRRKGRVKVQGGIFLFVVTGFQWGLGVVRPGLGFALLPRYRDFWRSFVLNLGCGSDFLPCPCPC